MAWITAGSSAFIFRILDPIPTDERNLTELSFVLLGWEVAQRNWDLSDPDTHRACHH
jgi:hypothetical protein